MPNVVLHCESRGGVGVLQYSQLKRRVTKKTKAEGLKSTQARCITGGGAVSQAEAEKTAETGMQYKYSETRSVGANWAGTNEFCIKIKNCCEYAY